MEARKTHPAERLLGALYGLWVLIGIAYFVCAARGVSFGGNELPAGGIVVYTLMGVGYLTVGVAVIAGRLFKGSRKEGG